MNANPLSLLAPTLGAWLLLLWPLMDVANAQRTDTDVDVDVDVRDEPPRPGSTWGPVYFTAPEQTSVVTAGYAGGELMIRDTFDTQFHAVEVGFALFHPVRFTFHIQVGDTVDVPGDFDRIFIRPMPVGVLFEGTVFRDDANRIRFGFNLGGRAGTALLLTDGEVDSWGWVSLEGYAGLHLYVGEAMFYANGGYGYNFRGFVLDSGDASVAPFIGEPEVADLWSVNVGLGFAF